VKLHVVKRQALVLVKAALYSAIASLNLSVATVMTTMRARNPARERGELFQDAAIALALFRAAYDDQLSLSFSERHLMNPWLNDAALNESIMLKRHPCSSIKAWAD
jgi:hypothetical protein